MKNFLFFMFGLMSNSIIEHATPSQLYLVEKTNWASKNEYLFFSKSIFLDNSQPTSPLPLSTGEGLLPKLKGSKVEWGEAYYAPILHAYHNSLTEMRLNTKDKIFEVEIKVFTDDFEKALSREAKTIIRIDANDKNDALINSYLQKHFVVNNAKNQTKPYTYLGKQVENDATWLIVELPMKEAIEPMNVRYDLLTDLYDDQVNLLNIILPNDRKSYLFNIKNKVQTVL